MYTEIFKYLSTISSWSITKCLIPIETKINVTVCTTTSIWSLQKLSIEFTLHNFLSNYLLHLIRVQTCSMLTSGGFSAVPRHPDKEQPSWLLLIMMSRNGLRWRTCTQRAWVQVPLVLIGVTGGGSKGIRPILLLCASKSPTLVPQHLGRHVRVLEHGSQQH